MTGRLTLPQGFPTEVMLLERPAEDSLPEGPWFLLADRKLRPAWEASGLPQPPGTLWVEVDEGSKRLPTLLPWLEHWAEAGYHRDATLVALGGGVLTDMGGLAAALFLRGISWHAWPTTLLSQVDAGLGGKTGVNLAAGKNLAGAFHSPARMVACRSFLRTLPPRDLAAGRWELVKMALLDGDASIALRMLEEAIPEPESLAFALRRKAEIVHRDPLEHGERRLLNLGHTLGHALEAASGHTLLHGEAVGLGLLAACCLAGALGMETFPEAFLRRMADALRPLAARVKPWSLCEAYLKRDKKALGSGADEERILSILPVPGRTAIQKALAPRSWEEAHTLMNTRLA
ncbi:MAG: 3-dehydroquinate synthase [Acidobacteria bacterium]|nr:3-dehydroquinate synthase [Acidobacteriota bacterium]